MQDIVKSPLFKILMTIFVFTVLFVSFGVVVVGPFIGVEVDPRLSNIVTFGMGVASAALMSFQGTMNTRLEEHRKSQIDKEVSKQLMENGD